LSKIPGEFRDRVVGPNVEQRREYITQGEDSSVSDPGLVIVRPMAIRKFPSVGRDSYSAVSAKILLLTCVSVLMICCSCC
jgi:hypothetical protein